MQTLCRSAMPLSLPLLHMTDVGPPVRPRSRRPSRLAGFLEPSLWMALLIALWFGAAQHVAALHALGHDTASRLRGSPPASAPAPAHAADVLLQTARSSYLKAEAEREADDGTLAGTCALCLLAAPVACAAPFAAPAMRLLDGMSHALAAAAAAVPAGFAAAVRARNRGPPAGQSIR